MNISVFKVGGGSLVDASRIKNILSIIKIKKQEDGLVLVISALGKVTNQLEKLVDFYFNGNEKSFTILEELKKFHFDIATDLGIANEMVLSELNDAFVEIEWLIEDEVQDSYDYIYDQIVPVGEILSSKIISAFLKHQQLDVIWQDIRDTLITDDNYRMASPLENVEKKISNSFTPLIKQGLIIVTQGFIGSTYDNHTTTLGKEGSDYSGALISAAINANKYVLWKNVEGIYDLDPNTNAKAKLLKNLSYEETQKIVSDGAKIIHPKSIEPLKLKGIPLQVRSYDNIEHEGSLITN